MDFFVILFDDVALQDLQGPAVLLNLNEEGGKVLALSFSDHCGDDILIQFPFAVLDICDYQDGRSNTK